jgi:hypothetical protein
MSRPLSPDEALAKLIDAVHKMIVAEYHEQHSPTPLPHMWWLELREAVEAGKDALGIE